MGSICGGQRKDAILQSVSLALVIEINAPFDEYSPQSFTKTL